MLRECARAIRRSVMCLAIPGKLIEKNEDDPLMPIGRVAFGGISKEVNLAYTPEARTGDYLLVHVGFAISIVDEKEAGRVFELLEELEEIPPPPG